MNQQFNLSHSSRLVLLMLLIKPRQIKLPRMVLKTLRMIGSLKMLRTDCRDQDFHQIELRMIPNDLKSLDKEVNMDLDLINSKITFQNIIDNTSEETMIKVHQLNMSQELKTHNSQNLDAIMRIVNIPRQQETWTDRCIDQDKINR